MKDRNVLKMLDRVTTIRQNHTGRNCPKRIPMMIAIMSLGNRPSLNFFFSTKTPPIILLKFPLAYWLILVYSVCNNM